MDELLDPQDDLRLEIAHAAARLIAEEGYDYPSARNKAIKTLVGKQKLPRQCIPLDEEIEDELRQYQAEFLSDTQPGELKALRLTALSLLQALEEFQPIVYGAVVNGTASQHSDLHVLTFAENPKEIDYWLLNQDIPFEPCEDALLGGRSHPAVAFQWKRTWVQLGSAEPRERRGLLRVKPDSERLFQTDLDGLQRLIDSTL